MNKTELIQKMAEITELPASTCKKALNAFMQIVINNLQNHKDTALTHLGTFAAIKRKARIGVNPRTGKKMTIPLAYVTKFRPAKSLKKLPMPE